MEKKAKKTPTSHQGYYAVFLESEEYGTDWYFRDSLQEALKTIGEMTKDALNRNDGVVRRIGLKIG